MTYADIARCVAMLPVSTDKPLTLTRSTVRASHFLTWPRVRGDLPDFAMINVAIKQGIAAR